MAKVKKVEFLRTWFVDGAPRWEAGKPYPLDDDTARQVKLGNAKEIEVEETAAKDAAESNTEKTNKKKR